MILKSFPKIVPFVR